MTLRERLTRKLETNYETAPKIKYNNNNLEMTWNRKEKFYIGIDEKNQEWISALQNSSVPMFYVKCTNKNEFDITCNHISIASILDKKKTCRKCGKEFDIKLDIPESSVAFKILGNLDEE